MGGAWSRSGLPLSPDATPLRHPHERAFQRLLLRDGAVDVDASADQAGDGLRSCLPCDPAQPDKSAV